MSIWVSIRGSIHLLMVKKTKGQELSEELLMDRKSIPETEHGLSKEADEFCEGYKAFLTNKTEREVIDYVLPILADRDTRSTSAGPSSRREPSSTRSTAGRPSSCAPRERGPSPREFASP